MSAETTRKRLQHHETAIRNRNAEAWVKDVVPYARGTVTIRIQGSEGGLAEVHVSEDGTIRADSGRIIRVP